MTAPFPFSFFYFSVFNFKLEEDAKLLGDSKTDSLKLFPHDLKK